jgi:hypothetical protein
MHGAKLMHASMRTFDFAPLDTNGSANIDQRARGGNCAQMGRQSNERLPVYVPAS